MKNRIYKYIFHEFIRNFIVVLFAFAAVIWTIQAVNFLDLVTDDGHAFKIYLLYSFLIITKIITKLIPFTFLIASIMTILKLEKDNELIILWSSGLNKIHIVNLMFRISILMVLVQLFMATIINPKTLNFSRTLLKNSELQFIPSLLKVRQFNDTVKGLTIFVENKKIDGTYENIFIKDEGRILTKVSGSDSGESSTIFAKSGYTTKDGKNLILFDGNIQTTENYENVSIITFKKTTINFSGIYTKTTNVPKIQEKPSIRIIHCMQEKNLFEKNCVLSNNIGILEGVESVKKTLTQNKIEFNRRFGMPLFIPLVSLISCFLLLSRKEKKNPTLYKFVFFILGISFLVGSEISVRYSGTSLGHAGIYYLIPLGLIPLVYLSLIRTFKYENLN